MGGSGSINSVVLFAQGWRRQCEGNGGGGDGGTAVIVTVAETTVSSNDGGRAMTEATGQASLGDSGVRKAVAV